MSGPDHGAGQLAAIRLRDVRWAPGGNVVIDGFTLDLALGRTTAIVGRSGCGKSSLLRLIAGLRELDGGTLEGAPSRRAFVFQDPGLLPWLSVRDNVALPLRFHPSGVGREETVDAALAAVGLATHEAALPAAISGGQRMRASLARALAVQPELLLLDEPFAALDGATRRSLQALVEARTASEGWTVLLVTHDLGDAARLADRVVVVDGPPLTVLADVPVAADRPRGPDAVADVVRRIEAVLG